MVLAAGGSTRMGGTNKLLERVDGLPIIAHVVQFIRAAGAEPIVVVTGHQAIDVQAAVPAAVVELVHNARWREGISTSIAAGVAALEGRAAGALICLGDMPRVSSGDVRALIDAFLSAHETRSRLEDGPAAYVPAFNGEWGNPVLWSAEWFSELRSLSGDRGAKSLMTELGSRVIEVAAGPGVLLDADTPDALAQLRASRRDASEPFDSTEGGA